MKFLQKGMHSKYCNYDNFFIGILKFVYTKLFHSKSFKIILFLILTHVQKFIPERKRLAKKNQFIYSLIIQDICFGISRKVSMIYEKDGGRERETLEMCHNLFIKTWFEITWMEETFTFDRTNEGTHERLTVKYITIEKKSSFFV